MCVFAEQLAAPVLTVESVSSSGDLCNVTVTCRAGDLSLTSTCDISTCTQEEQTAPSSLAISIKDDVIICNHSNPVSWHHATVELETQRYSAQRKKHQFNYFFYCISWDSFWVSHECWFTWLTVCHEDYSKFLLLCLCRPRVSSWWQADPYMDLYNCCFRTSTTRPCPHWWSFVFSNAFKESRYSAAYVIWVTHCFQWSNIWHPTNYQ